MASASSLDGLIRWLRHDEWRNAFEEVLAEHFDLARDEFDIEPDELTSLLGQPLYMNLWGCAFEDLLSREGEDARNIVDDYLKRRGWKESASTRAYMTGLRSSVMSLHEVSEVVPGRSFRARDLILGGEPVLIDERTATRTLKPWDVIGARVMPIGQGFVVGGGLLIFERDVASEFITALQREIAGLAIGQQPAGTPEPVNDARQALAGLAPLFSAVWLNRTLEQVLEPDLPELENTDGEALLFCTVRWPMTPGITPEAIAAELDRVAELRKESATFWNWIRPTETAEKGRGKRTSRKTTPSPGQTFGTYMDDGATVLGNVELRESAVVLMANSLARAERGQVLLEEVLGERIGTSLIETVTPEQMMKERSASGITDRAPGTPLSPDDEREVVHAALDEHYRRTLDEPIGMLGGKSPRQAVRSKAGRAKVIEWLKYLENSTARQPAGDALATYDFAWLWKELGLADERR